VSDVSFVEHNKGGVTMKRLKLAAWCVGLFAACATVPVSQAADAKFPSRPVRLLVPYAPGGATDNTARLLANKLSEVWGQQVIVDNRAGGSGIIALELASNAAPDGYTLLVGNVSTNAINESAFAKQMKFKPSRELTGVTNLIELPHFFLVSGAVPVSSLKELVALAKKQKLSYASAGIASYPHLDVARFLKAAGIEMTHVPYKGGAGQMIPALISNETQFAFLNIASTIGQLKAGRLKALTTSWPTRRPEFPEVPTMAEAGFPGIGTNAWNGLFAPAKMSKPLLNQIFADVVKAMESPDMKAALDKQYMSVVVNTSPADFQKFVEADVKKWRQVIEENHIQIE
jgi:tripartite-type tricarboxylate transporter receptor subunit TctC